ncbi:MAG: thioredoxin [Gammaproteobacteria bacterium]|nr:thioredoxin [Gammaproteobacteria bacterium]
MIEGNSQNFKVEVLDTSMTLPVLVDFWAPWCPPCKALGPILEKVEESKQTQFQLVKVNTDIATEVATDYNIRSIPTCVLFKNGQECDRFIGLLSERQVLEFLKKHQV